MIERALVVGLGSIGKRHLGLLRSALPDADIRVLRHARCDEFIEHADGCFDNLAVACHFKPQVAVIASPAPFHLGVAMALAENNSHLMIEKPISDGIVGVSDLINLCAKRRLQLQVGYNLRFLKTLQFFRAKLAEGVIGSIRAVRCEIGQYLPEWRPDIDYRSTVSAQASLAGGVLLELSHELDMLRWVFGDVAWVSAWIGRQSELEIDVEDYVMLQVGFAGGPVGQVGMDFLRRDPTRTCIAIGEKGTLSWNAISGTVARFDPGSRAWTEIFSAKVDRNSSYASQIDALLTAAESGQPSAVAATGEDGLAVMELVATARDSDARDGRRLLVGAA